jgi:hypothetical protein
MSFLEPYGDVFENAEFSDSSITNSVSQGINVLEHMNTTLNESSVENDFNLRVQLYENNEIFNEIPNTEQRDDEIESLEQMVTKGQEMLKNKIIEYSKLKGTLEEIQSDKHTFNDLNTTIKRALNIMAELQIEDDSVKIEVDEIYKRVDNLNKKINLLYDEKIKSTHKTFDETTQKLLQLRKVYQVLKESDICYTCPICLSKPVDMFFVPCGHCLCSTCMEQTSRQCFICRKEFIKKSNLYFVG